jgi:hypothetical protein
MWRGPLRFMIPAMTQPATSPRVLLVADGRPPKLAPLGTRVRRYRLARLRFDGRATDPAARYDHLKRIYD